MQTSSTGVPNESMHLPSVDGETQSLAAARSFRSRLPSRMLALAAIWSEEQERARVAGHRYEILRVGPRSSLPRRDRAGIAQQVFREIYADK